MHRLFFCCGLTLVTYCTGEQAVKTQACTTNRLLPTYPYHHITVLHKYEINAISLEEEEEDSRK